MVSTYVEQEWYQHLLYGLLWDNEMMHEKWLYMAWHIASAPQMLAINPLLFCPVAGEPGCQRSVSSRSGSAEAGNWSSHQAAILLDHKLPFLCFPQEAPSHLYFVWQLLVAYPNPFLPFTLLIKCLYYCGPQCTSWNTIFPSLSCSEVWLMPKVFWPLRWEHEFVGRDFLGRSLKEGGKAREKTFLSLPFIHPIG